MYLLLVTVVLDRGGPAPGLSLACAVIPFSLLMQTVINAMDTIQTRRSVIANMAFPRSLMPIASALTESLGFAASLLLVVGMMAVYGVAPHAGMLWFPLVFAMNLVFAMAVAYPATLAGLWVRDLRPFIVSFVRTLFFLAPGLVALDQIPDSVHTLVKLNPLSGIFEAYRSVLLYGHAPAPWEILYPLAVAGAIVALFVPIYRREQGHMAKVIE